MQSVIIGAKIADATAEDVFDRVVEFERYPELVSTVKSVDVDRTGDIGRPTSDWQVYFRNGILRWKEIDVLDRVGLTVEFDQISGDFDVFRGTWVLVQKDTDTDLSFHADFDFGVPSLASIIDPVAVRVLTETIRTTISGLFGEAVTFHATRSTLDSSDAVMPVTS